MRLRNLFIASGILLFLAGCSGDVGPYGVKSAKWYEHHRAEDMKQLAWCHNHAGSKEKMAACVNAQTGANWRYAKEPKSPTGGVPSNLF
jgi:hypothetical protein